jgi:hypothetical protein
VLKLQQATQKNAVCEERSNATQKIERKRANPKSSNCNSIKRGFQNTQMTTRICMTLTTRFTVSRVRIVIDTIIKPFLLANGKKKEKEGKKRLSTGLLVELRHSRVRKVDVVGPDGGQKPPAMSGPHPPNIVSMPAWTVTCPRACSWFVT